MGYFFKKKLIEFIKIFLSIILFLVLKWADCSLAWTPASVLPEPITLILSFKNLSTNLDWIVLGGDTTVDEFYFVYGTNENQKTETYLIEPAIPFQEMKAYEASSKKADFKEHSITIEKLLKN